jgi:hypothetical protein
MINYGWIVIGLGVILYIIGTILFNIKLRRENLLEGNPSISKKRAIAKKLANESVIFSSLSFWLMITLLPSVHIIVIGLLMVLIAWVIDWFN